MTWSGLRGSWALWRNPGASGGLGASTQKLVRVAVSIEHDGEVRQISVPQGSLEVVAAGNDAGANGDESSEPGRGEPIHHEYLLNMKIMAHGNLDLLQENI